MANNLLLCGSGAGKNVLLYFSRMRDEFLFTCNQDLRRVKPCRRKMEKSDAIALFFFALALPG